MTLTLPPDPADSVPGLTPRGSGERASPWDRLPAPREPLGLVLGHRQRAVRQRHRVAPGHQSAAALPAPGSCAADTCRRFAWEGGWRGRGGGRTSRSSLRPPLVFLHIPPTELLTPLGTEGMEQGRCPLPSAPAMGGCRCRGHLGQAKSPHRPPPRRTTSGRGHGS